MFDTKMLTQIFREAYFLKSPKWKLKCPSKGERTDKLWYVHKWNTIPQ